MQKLNKTKKSGLNMPVKSLKRGNATKPANNTVILLSKENKIKMDNIYYRLSGGLPPITWLKSNPGHLLEFIWETFRSGVHWQVVYRYLKQFNLDMNKLIEAQVKKSSMGQLHKLHEWPVRCGQETRRISLDDIYVLWNFNKKPDADGCIKLNNRIFFVYEKCPDYWFMIPVTDGDWKLYVCKNEEKQNKQQKGWSKLERLGSRWHGVWAR